MCSIVGVCSASVPDTVVWYLNTHIMSCHNDGITQSQSHNTHNHNSDDNKTKIQQQTLIKHDTSTHQVRILMLVLFKLSSEVSLEKLYHAVTFIDCFHQYYLNKVHFCYLRVYSQEEIINIASYCPTHPLH